MKFWVMDSRSPFRHSKHQRLYMHGESVRWYPFFSWCVYSVHNMHNSECLNKSKSYLQNWKCAKDMHFQGYIFTWTTYGEVIPGTSQSDLNIWTHHSDCSQEALCGWQEVGVQPLDDPFPHLMETISSFGVWCLGWNKIFFLKRLNLYTLPFPSSSTKHRKTRQVWVTV